MEREIHKLGVTKQHTYDELVRYIETDPTKIRFQTGNHISGETTLS